MVGQAQGAHARGMTTAHHQAFAGEPPLLRRPVQGRMIAGVAAAVADYLDLEPNLVRIAAVVLALMGGFAVPLYLAAWLLIPEEGSDLSIAQEMMEARRAR